MADVTVITPTIPDRAPWLVRAMHSVAEQTTPPAAHLVGSDIARRGPAAIRNELVAAATTDWVAFLDDDDLMKPWHLATLMDATLVDDVDVVGAYCDFDGPALPDRYCNRPYDRDVMRKHGIMPITVVARRAAILAADGFRIEDRYEDWALWNRMADAGCRFMILPVVTWTYRTATPHRRTHDAA